MIIALKLVVSAIIVLIVWMLVRTCAHKPREPLASPERMQRATDQVNIERAVRSLSEAIQVKTVSLADPSLIDYEEFGRFHALLESLFPLVHRELEKTALGHNLVYRWNGQDSLKKPIALMSHMDVVPADDEGWKHPAYSGAIEGGYVWGRGALDIKCGLVGILESIEELLEQGYTPTRDIYVISTSDEEIGGRVGITAVASFLRESNVNFEWVLDEGGVVGEGLMEGFYRPVGLIGIAEKGYLDLQLSVEMEGGHSAYPGKDTAIGVLSEAIKRVEAAQMKSRLASPVKEFFDELGRYMDFGSRFAFANRAILEPVIIRRLLKGPQTAALVRTTTAPTVMFGGSKPNVLPHQAFAVINFRLLPGDTTEDVVKHTAYAINDERVKLSVLAESPASKISSPDSAAYRLIRDCAREQFPEAIIAPYLVVGGTDSKTLESLAEGVYRFTPIQVGKDDIAGMHGVNERMSVGNLERAVKFYTSIIVNS